MRQGAVLIDIREADEHARERIPGARHHALSRLDADNPARPGDDVLVFHCRSGARTKANAPRLAAAAAGCETYVLEGGLEAWKKAGLPTAIDRKQPIEINRQVQITAGSMVLAGVVLGALVSPWLLYPFRFRRRRADVRWHHRLLRHGAAVRADAVESAHRLARSRGSHRWRTPPPRHDNVRPRRHPFGPLRQPRRLHARAGRRRRLDPGDAVDDLRGRRAFDPCRDRHQRGRRGGQRAANLIGHARARTVKWPCAAVFAISGMTGAAGGAELGKMVDGHRLLLLFGVLMIVVGLLMLRPRKSAGDADVKLNRAARKRLLPLLIGFGLRSARLPASSASAAAS